jgi:hypothetical protein
LEVFTMKKKILSLLVAGATMISGVPVVTANDVSAINYDVTISRDAVHNFVSVSFNNTCCMSNELLAELIADGTIPRDTTRLIIDPQWGVGCCFADYEEYLEAFQGGGLPSRTISDLSPLRSLPFLEELNLARHGIEDLTPLAGMTSLRTLNFWGSSIECLTPLSNLTNLTNLSLCGGNISDLSPLSNLTNLRNVAIRNSNITDVSALSALNNLTVLDLTGNPISNVNAFNGKDVEVLWDGGATSISTGKMLGILVGNGSATISDALAILRFAVGLDSIVGECEYAFQAALIVSEEQPGVRDALQILRSLVGLESALS